MKYIYSYDNHSESAVLLRNHGIAQGDATVLLRHENSTFKGHPSKTVLNWGSSKVPYEVLKCKVINHPCYVSSAINKIKFLRLMTDEGHADLIPEFTTDKVVAQGWLNDGDTVVVRHRVKGHASQGIEIYTPPNNILPDAPLYTKYVKKKREFRVHVVRTAAGPHNFLIQEKKKKLNVRATDQDYMVRDPDKFAFCRADHINDELLYKLQAAAVSTLAATKLDFGGVDIGYNQYYNKCTVYEINSAPGIDGTDIPWYYHQLSSI